MTFNWNRYSNFRSVKGWKDAYGPDEMQCVCVCVYRDGGWVLILSTSMWPLKSCLSRWYSRWIPQYPFRFTNSLFNCVLPQMCSFYHIYYFKDFKFPPSFLIAFKSPLLLLMYLFIFQLFVCFLLSSCRSSSYILSVNPLSDLGFADIFSRLLGCHFILLVVSFAVQNTNLYTIQYP